MVDGSGTTTYTRDALYRPTSIQDGGGSTVSYAYDAAGRPTSTTYPGGTEVVTYAYDNANRLTSVTDWLSKVTSYTYDNANRLTSTTLGNGLIADRTYDNADGLLTLVNRNGGVTISSYTYTLDAVGNRTQRVDTLGTESYAYDARYQLTGTTYANGDVQSYTYDAMGNRTQKVHNGTPTGYSYDIGDQMTLAGGVSYTYDNNGNQTAAGADIFSWDAEDRMAGTVIGGVTGTYAYNGNGLRTSRTIGGTTVTYVWDQTAAMPVVLRDSAGNRYVYGLDLISRTDSGGAQEYYLTDGLGSTTGLADGTGAVTDSYTYDVYGAVRSHSGASGNEFTYTGEQVDGTGLQYLRARYYDAATGRFASRDPLPLMQRYAYVGGNPVNWVDPTGRCHEPGETYIHPEPVAQRTPVPSAGTANRHVDAGGANACAPPPPHYEGCGFGCFLRRAGSLLSSWETDAQLFDLLPTDMLCAPLAPAAVSGVGAGAVATCIVAFDVSPALASFGAGMKQARESDCEEWRKWVAYGSNTANLGADVAPGPVSSPLEIGLFGISTWALSC